MSNQEYCIYGHIRNEANTYIAPKGHRECRVCRHQRAIAYRKIKIEKYPEYNVWEKMKYRCRDKSDMRYGGRGIKVCDRWQKSFWDFLEDMGNRPSKLYSIERIDNDGNYEPSNCKWATKYEQVHNYRRNRFFTSNGKTQTIDQWATEYKIEYATLYYRLVISKWPIDKALKGATV